MLDQAAAAGARYANAEGEKEGEKEDVEEGEQEGEQEDETDDGAAYDKMSDDDGDVDDAGGKGGDVEVGGGAAVDAAEAVACDVAQIPEDWLVLGRKLGKGAFGDVLAGDVSLNFGLGSHKEPVACKAIQDETKEADLMRECRFHMKLKHANILQVHGIRSWCGWVHGASM